MKRIIIKNKGSLLLELLVAIAILVVVLSVGTQTVFVSLRSSKVSSERDVATGLANEAFEAVRGVTEENWHNIYGLIKSPQHYYATSTVPLGKWTLAAGDEIISLNKTDFTRYIIIDNVSRDPTTRAIDASYILTNDDPSTQKATVTVSWPNADPVTLSGYFFRWENKICSQTSWAGAPLSGNVAQVCGTVRYDTIDPVVSAASGTLKLSGGSDMTFVAVANADVSATNLTVNKPAGTVNNDIMFTLVMHKANEAPNTIPAGWTLLGFKSIAGAYYYSLYWKLAAGEPASYTWKWPTSQRSALTVVSYRGGFLTGTPIDVFSNTAYTTKDSIIRAATMNVTAINSPIIFWGGLYFQNGTTFTAPILPAAMTKDVDFFNGTSRYNRIVGSTAWAGSGATGNMDAIIVAGPQGAVKHGFAVALKPTAPVPLSISGAVTSSVFDSTGFSPGGGYNSIFWKGTMGTGNTGKVRFQFAGSDCLNGATNAPTCTVGVWSYIGGATCATGDWFDPGAPNITVELKGATCQTVWNNKRYFKYKVQICSNDCVTAGLYSPTVTGIVVNLAP